MFDVASLGWCVVVEIKKRPKDSPIMWRLVDYSESDCCDLRKIDGALAKDADNGERVMVVIEYTYGKGCSVVKWFTDPKKVNWGDAQRWVKDFHLADVFANVSFLRRNGAIHDYVPESGFPYCSADEFVDTVQNHIKLMEE